MADDSKPFIQKLYQMTSDLSNASMVGWTEDGRALAVVDIEPFVAQLLPFYFKHSNLSSFVRQLNTYGFSKIDSSAWTFAHPDFLRGEPERLKNIQRKQSSQRPVAAGQAEGTTELTVHGPVGAPPVGVSGAGSAGLVGPEMQTMMGRIQELSEQVKEARLKQADTRASIGKMMTLLSQVNNVALARVPLSDVAERPVRTPYAARIRTLYTPYTPSTLHRLCHHHVAPHCIAALCRSMWRRQVYADHGGSSATFGLDSDSAAGAVSAGGRSAAGLLTDVTDVSDVSGAASKRQRLAPSGVGRAADGVRGAVNGGGVPSPVLLRTDSVEPRIVDTSAEPAFLAPPPPRQPLQPGPSAPITTPSLSTIGTGSAGGASAGAASSGSHEPLMPLPPMLSRNTSQTSSLGAHVARQLPEELRDLALELVGSTELQDATLRECKEGCSNGAADPADVDAYLWDFLEEAQSLD